MNFGSEMVEALQVSRKNIFCSLNVDKIKEKRIFEIVHCPFELSPNQHRPAGPFGWLYWCSSAQPSKGQCTISKILSSPILSLFIEQNIFFPETYNAYTISEPKFTVCDLHFKNLCYCKSLIRSGTCIQKSLVLYQRCFKHYIVLIQKNWFLSWEDWLIFVLGLWKIFKSPI